MKVFIIAAVSKDGFIAKSAEQNSMNWTSAEDKKFFVEKTKEAGVVVMGRKTFETFGKPLKERRNIIMSRQNLHIEGVETTNESPEELIKRLQSEGEQEIAICGGAEIYKLFMEKNLVDEVFLTEEDIEFGEGVPFLPQKLGQKLELISSTNLSPSTILLNYRVQK
ncbi:MAG: dihydrofolate reductase [Candidatus Pacebacteria bacterium]|nr:dihydrofolate reductase [Candidatus Paceibacterota bacterium]